MSTIAYTHIVDLPLPARVISGVARRWPWWKGRSRLLQFFDAAVADRRSGMAIATLRDSGVRLRVPLSDDAGRRAVAFGESDADVFRFLRVAVAHALERADDSVFLDIGANLGIFLFRVGERFAIRCIGFEPQADLCGLLEANRRANTFKGTIECRGVALGSAAGDAFLDVHPVDSGSSRVGSGGGVRIPMSTLEAEFSPDEWRRVAIAKIDVEGFEIEVFRGARKLFARHRPTLVFEVNSWEMRQRGLRPADVGQVLREVGYDDFWALDRRIYPIRNGVYQVANVVAVGAAGLEPLRRFGIDERFQPTAKKFWPVLYYDF